MLRGGEKDGGGNLSRGMVSLAYWRPTKGGPPSVDYLVTAPLCAAAVSVAAPFFPAARSISRVIRRRPL